MVALRVAGCSCYIQTSALSKAERHLVNTKLCRRHCRTPSFAWTPADLSLCPDAHFPAPLLPDAAACVRRLPARKRRALRDARFRANSPAAGRSQRHRKHDGGWSGERGWDKLAYELDSTHWLDKYSLPQRIDSRFDGDNYNGNRALGCSFNNHC